MESTQWRKPIVSAHQGGMNAIIARSLAASPYAHLLGNGYYSPEVTVHAYREVGTAVEAAIEIRFFDLDTNKLKLVQLANIIL